MYTVFLTTALMVPAVPQAASGPAIAAPQIAAPQIVVPYKAHCPQVDLKLPCPGKAPTICPQLTPSRPPIPVTPICAPNVLIKPVCMPIPGRPSVPGCPPLAPCPPTVNVHACPPTVNVHPCPPAYAAPAPPVRSK